MHRLFGCWLSCTVIWLGNNVKHRFIHIYKMLAVWKSGHGSVLRLTPCCCSGRSHGRTEARLSHSLTYMWAESLDLRSSQTEPGPGGMTLRRVEAPESTKKGSVAASQKKMLNSLECDAECDTVIWPWLDGASLPMTPPHEGNLGNFNSFLPVTDKNPLC